MVVQSSEVILDQLDLGHLALFVGLRVNELVLERLAKAGIKRVRESYGYLIQHLIPAERSITELADRMGVTQQASSKMVAELTYLGILEVRKGEDGRAKRVRLSSNGWKLVELSRHTRKQVHRRLIRQLGERKYQATRTLLLQCLDRLGGIEAVRQRRVRMPR